MKNELEQAIEGSDESLNQWLSDVNVKDFRELLRDSFEKREQRDEEVARLARGAPAEQYPEPRGTEARCALATGWLPPDGGASLIAFIRNAPIEELRALLTAADFEKLNEAARVGSQP